MGFTQTQNRLLGITRIPPCLLSIISDVIILRLVHHNMYKGPYQRILFGMSVCDAIFNIAWIMQPIGVKDDGPICDATAMLSQIGLATFFYSTALSLYFVLTIRFGMRDEKVARHYEPWIHLICIGFSLLTAIVGVILQGYRADGITMTCYMHEYPRGCSDDSPNGEDCKFALIWLFAGGPQLILLVSIIVNYLIICCHVRGTIHRGRTHQRYVDSDDSQTRRVRAVAVQATLYVVASLATTLPIPILTLFWESGFMAKAKDESVFSITYILYLFVPLTGFLNLCVYIRPQYIKHRTDSPDMGKVWAVRRCCYLGGAEPVRSPKGKKRQIEGKKNDEGGIRHHQQQQQQQYHVEDDTDPYSPCEVAADSSCPADAQQDAASTTTPVETTEAWTATPPDEAAGSMSTLEFLRSVDLYPSRY